MALGGGTFVTQNKTLPGSYINFVSARAASASSGERGTAAIALELDWGAEGQLIDLSTEEFARNSLTVLGADYADDKLKGLRDVFKHAQRVFTYRLNGGGVKAANTFGTAKYSGTAGNSLKTVIEQNVSDNTLFDVKTYFGTRLVETQTVAAASALVDNAFVDFDKTATLATTAGTSFTGGTNGTATADSHQAFLNKLEIVACNAVGVVTETQAINVLYAAFAKRLRDELGIKLQAVVYNYAADSEAVVNVMNGKDAVYWVLGVIAGTAVNRSATNLIYDGEYAVSADYTQTQLEQAINAGKFALHRVGDNLRVLSDINSLVTVTDTHGDIFKDNKVVRVADSIATSTAAIFNERHLGTTPNNAVGRELLWSDIVSMLGDLRDAGAIEAFDSDDVVIEPGADRHSVVVRETVTVAGAMEKLYMTCVIE